VLLLYQETSILYSIYVFLYKNLSGGREPEPPAHSFSCWAWYSQGIQCD